MNKTHIYKIIFHNEAKVYEIFAQQIYQGELYGFVELEELLFGERSSVVVDPTEERLKTEFEGVKRSYIPMHNIIRIDEVEKQGIAKIKPPTKAGDNISHFPSPAYGPKGEPGNN